jgi:hypothetical protein
VVAPVSSTPPAIPTAERTSPTATAQATSVRPAVPNRRRAVPAATRGTPAIAPNQGRVPEPLPLYSRD